MVRNVNTILESWLCLESITLTNSVHEKKTLRCEILNQLKKGHSQVNVTFVMEAFL